MTVAAFDFLEFECRWVAWRNESRNDGQTTKVPHSPHGGPAKADDPRTWNTRSAAKARARKLVNGHGGGIGIELGDLGDGTSIGGIDLDTCLVDGVFEPWASEVITRFNSYGEISPSGTGAKIFFRYQTADLPTIRSAMGGPLHGKEFKRRNGKEHPPAIELHVTNRYFTVTEQKLDGVPDEIATVATELILWVLNEAGPAFVGKAKAGSKKASADNSRSAVAFRLARNMKGDGKSYEEWLEALQADPDTASWYHNSDERQLRRTWDRAKVSSGVDLAFSEDALALKFTEQHGNDLRYCAKWGEWLRWDGTSWRFEDTLRAFDFARAICRSAAAEAHKPPLASGKTVAAIVALARADRRHATTPEQWDADAWTLSGATSVDLRTGQIYEPRRENYSTRTAAVAPDKNGCPLWLAFLDRVTAGDAELQNYLQRVAGYALTGVTKEHALFFFHGTGGNGKGVFLNTLRDIWADYAVVATMETFMEAQTDRHPTDLAMLRGARLVIAQETKARRRWDASKINALTGGDPIRARFMRQDFFEYTPQFKLLIAGNHKPSLRGVDEATGRRFNLIPFTVTIPENERDLDLRDKLKSEWGGILQWAIDGCLAWQRMGLAPPQAVLAATAEYLSDEDAIGRWLDERCAFDPRYKELSSLLFADWKQWAEDAREPVGSWKSFTQDLKDRKLVSGLQSGTRRALFHGIALQRGNCS